MVKLLATTALAMTLLLDASSAATQRWRTGTAVDLSSGELIYKAFHHETLADGRVLLDKVRYVDPKGSALAAKRTDFSRSSMTPEFQLINARTGHREGLKLDDAGGFHVSFKRSEKHEAKSLLLQGPNNALADAGFDRFIEDNWDRLVAGEVLIRDFLIPSELDFFSFQIKTVPAADPQAHVHFVMEAENFLIRLLTPSITVRYDRLTRRLLRYDGPSNLRDEEGSNYLVKIEFEYGDPAALEKGAAESDISATFDDRSTNETSQRYSGGNGYKVKQNSAPKSRYWM